MYEASFGQYYTLETESFHRVYHYSWDGTSNTCAHMACSSVRYWTSLLRTDTCHMMAHDIMAVKPMCFDYGRRNISTSFSIRQTVS